MKKWTMAALTVLLSGSAVYSQNSCPIELQKIDPRSYPFSAGLLGSEQDPWDSYLRIEYRNTSGKSIVGIRFQVEFVNSLADAKPSVYAYTSDEVVKPGNVSKPYWGDGVYLHEYGRSMGAIAWVDKIRFSDNSFFDDDGARVCSLPKQARAVATPQVAPSEDQRAMVKNSEAGKNSPAAAVLLADEGHILSPEEMAERVQKGKASRCAVITIPAGAKIWIDGVEAGVSPMDFVLTRHADTPRLIKITMNGYKTVERQVVPDGKTIPIGLSLEPN
jgi:PEGA domain